MKENIRTIFYQNKKYDVCEWVIDKLSEFGIDFSDQYIAYLLDNDSPRFPSSLTFLAMHDIYNKEMIGSKGLLGKIVKIDKAGEIIDYFDTVYDASMDAINNNKYKYSFEKIHNKNSMNSKDSFDFFGITIKVKNCNYDCEIISKLNRTIKRNVNRYYGKNRIFREMYTDEIASIMSYDEYVIRGIKWQSFVYGAYIRQTSNDSCNKYLYHDVQRSKDYPKRIESLFKRYTYQSECAFLKIKNLNEVKNYFGIYLLCLPQINGCYVGKTNKCFVKRITQHFTNPNTAFDNNYKPSDIKEIYVMLLGESIQIIDLIERDCIAILGKEVCLNALAGGDSIELIKSERYDEKQHILSSSVLKNVIEDSLNIAMYRKEDMEEEKLNHK